MGKSERRRAGLLNSSAAISSEAGARIKQQEQPPRSAYSVDDFCYAHDISRVTFYKLLKEGRGPAIMKIGTATRVRVEAAAAWRRRMESETAQAA